MGVMMVEEFKSSPKRELRCTRSRSTSTNHQHKSGRTNVLDSIAKGGKVTSYTAEDGSVRVKILVKKQDLKHILGAMNTCNLNNINGGNNRSRPSLSSVSITSTPSSSSSMERRLYDLMRKRRAASNGQAKRSSSTSTSTSWTPALHSIPEEH